MKYKIQYDANTDTYKCDGWTENFVGCHLVRMASFHRIKEAENAISESHMLFILRENGIDIDLLDEDGSELIW